MWNIRFEKFDSVQSNVNTTSYNWRHKRNSCITKWFKLVCQIKVLKEFPAAFDSDQFEQMCNSLLPEWQSLTKQQRNELIEMVIERNVLNQDIFKKIKKILKKYMEEKKLALATSFVELEHKKEFLNRLTNLSASLKESNLYVDYLCDSLISCQIDYSKSIIDQTNSCESVVARALNTLLEFCLKFNYNSLELLEFVNTSINKNGLSNGVFKPDLFVFYAGICNFKE